MKINMIDVGAVGGLELPWSRTPSLLGSVLSFEPNAPQEVLQGDDVMLGTAIWNFDGVAEFTTYGVDGVGSSLLKQNVDWVRENFEMIRAQGSAALADTWFERAAPTGSFVCEVRRLDTALTRLRSLNAGAERYHFLKTDTQSGEWFVLDGARDYLSAECLGLEIEAFRYPLYEDLRTEDEVHEFLQDYGFERWGWTGYKNSFLSQADYLYLRREPAAEDRPMVQAIKTLYGTSGADSIIKRPTLFERARSRSSALMRKLARSSA